MKLTLNTQIFIGALLGLAGGFYLNTLGPSSDVHQSGIYICGIVGGIFVDLLKMILIPLVFTSITVGIANLRAHAQMHKVWPLTLTYFLSTTVLASTLGLIVINVFKPGVGLKLDMFKDAMTSFNAEHLTLSQFVAKFAHGLFMNPIAAMANGEVLATVIFALFLGIALIVLGDKSKNILKLLKVKSSVDKTVWQISSDPKTL